MHFRVRRAAPADAPAAAAFGRAAFSAAFGFLYAPEALARYLDAVYAPAAVAAWLRNPRMLLVLAEEAVGEADAGAVADAGAEADAPAAHTMTAAPPIVGFALAGPVEVPHSDARRAADGELRKLYVAEAATGRGVAQALLAPCVRWVREGRCRAADADAADGTAGEEQPARVYLGVWSENARALAFYRKCGFAVVGEFVPEGWVEMRACDGGERRSDVELVMRLNPGVATAH